MRELHYVAADIAQFLNSIAAGRWVHGNKVILAVYLRAISLGEYSFRTPQAMVALCIR